MLGPAQLIQRTSDGEMASAGIPYVVSAVILTAGAGATGTVDLKTGGSGGTILLSLSAVQGTTVAVPFPGGVVFPAGVYADLGGVGASVSVALE